METAFFQICIKAISPEDFQNPSNSFDVSFSWIFGIDKNIFQIYNDKNIGLLIQDLVNIALEAS